MLEQTRRHLAHYGWSGKGRLSNDDVKSLLKRSGLKYFDKVGDFTGKYEGLMIFTRSVDPDSTGKYVDEVQAGPLYKDELNLHVCLDLESTIDSFESYEVNPPYDVFIGRTFCPVGKWMAVFGHGFIVMDTDGMLYMTTHDTIGVISESEFDFFDRLVALNEMCRVDPNRYFARFDMRLCKSE